MLSNYIRAGKSETITDLLKGEHLWLLNTVYTFQVNMKRKKPIHGRSVPRTSDYTSSYLDDEDEVATLEVSPLHLAIISKQSSSLEAILKEVVTSMAPSSLQMQESERNKIIDSRVKVIFPSDNASLYEDDGRMLDGMNILHLAAKYYPEGLEVIIRFARKHERLYKDIKGLLFEQDNQIKNNPLHVAASSSSIVALR